MTDSRRADKPARAWYRLHASTYVMLLITVAVLSLLNVPGSRRVAFNGVPSTPFGGFSLLTHQIEHGWPWTHLIRDEYSKDYDPLTGESRLTSLWSFEEDFISRSIWALAGNVAVALLVVGTVALGVEHWRRRRRRVWQLTVVDLLALTALVASTTAYTLNAIRRYDEERDALRSMQIVVDGNDVLASFRMFECEYQRPGPHWLREVVGDWWPEWFDRVVWVAVGPNDLEKVPSLGSLGAILVYGTAPDDARLIALGKLEHLRVVVLEVVGDFEPDRHAAAATVLDRIGRPKQLEGVYVHGWGTCDRIGSWYFAKTEFKDVFIGYPPQWEKIRPRPISASPNGSQAD